MTKLFDQFFQSEKAASLTLITCTLVSLLLPNSDLDAAYHHICQTQWAVLVSYSRIYNDVHYPDDMIVAGIIDW